MTQREIKWEVKKSRESLENRWHWVDKYDAVCWMNQALIQCIPWKWVCEWGLEEGKLSQDQKICDRSHEGKT